MDLEPDPPPGALSAPGALAGPPCGGVAPAASAVVPALGASPAQGHHFIVGDHVIFRGGDYEGASGRVASVGPSQIVVCIPRKSVHGGQSVTVEPGVLVRPQQLRRGRGRGSG